VISSLDINFIPFALDYQRMALDNRGKVLYKRNEHFKMIASHPNCLEILAFQDFLESFIGLTKVVNEDRAERLRYSE
jgi:hypothetical protein